MFEQLSDLPPFPVQLFGIIEILILAAATLLKQRTRRLHPMFGRAQHLNKVAVGKVLLVSPDPHPNKLSRQGEGYEHNPSAAITLPAICRFGRSRQRHAPQSLAHVGQSRDFDFDFRSPRKGILPKCVFVPHRTKDPTRLAARVQDKQPSSARIAFSPGHRALSFHKVNPEPITSLQNPRVKNLVKLRDRGPRDEQGVFVIEGFRAIARALDREVPLRELYFCRDWFLGTNEDSLLERARNAGTELIELGKNALAKAAYRDRPEGLLAVADQWHNKPTDLRLTDEPFLLVIEAIEKPGNLGTILRSADAAGVHAVIICDPVTDLFNPNVVRSSTGVLFSVPVAMAATDEVISFLKNRGVRTVATTPAASLSYTNCNLTGPLAIVMGSEQFGLSEIWLNSCDQQVRIPMAGQADSLNVAMATIVTLFESVRQRSSQP